MNTKKLLSTVLALVTCFCLTLLTGCSDTSKNNNVGETVSDSNKKTTYTFSEYLRESNNSPLLFFYAEDVAKDSRVYDIFVCQNEKVKMYPNYGDKTLGYYAEMSDAEIFEYLEREWEKEFCAFVQEFIDDTAWPTRFRSGEATIYVKNYIVPTIELITDQTGNNVAKQVVYFPSETALSLDSTVWYDGHVWDNPKEYDYVNTSSISGMTEDFRFTNRSKMYEVYSSRYVGIASERGSSYLLTRSSRDVTITLDAKDESFAIDLDESDKQDLAYSFYEQYRKNYQTFNEVSKRFTSLKLPDCLETLRIGYTEFDDFSYIDADGKLTGYDVELIQKICDELGITAHFVSFNSLTNGKEALLNNTIDCLVGGLTLLDDSEFYMIDSCRVYYYDNSAFYHCGLAFRRDLEGLTLFNQACAKFSKDGTIGSLLNKYRHAYAKD